MRRERSLELASLSPCKLALIKIPAAFLHLIQSVQTWLSDKDIQERERDRVQRVNWA